MGELCGWTGYSDSQDHQRDIAARMSVTLTRHGGNRMQLQTGSQSALILTSNNDHLDIFRDGHILAVITGQPTWTAPELAELAKHHGLAKTLADGYKKQGPQILTSLGGAFAVAIINERDNEALLAIDRMGICPLAFSVVDGCLIFGSTTGAIKAHPAATVELDPQAIYNYVYFHVVPAPGSIYRNVQRLLPGTYLQYTNGHIQTNNYWEPRYEPQPVSSISDLKQQLHDILRSSVRLACDGSTQPGAFLSGGMDSSTVAGILGEVSNEPARTYSIGFDAEGYDEMEYARTAAKHFSAKHHEYYVTPEDVVNAVPKVAAMYDQPFGNASAVPAYYCAKLAKEDGIDRLLAGDGGDELFGGNTRYAKQQMFSRYEQLPRLIKRYFVEPLILSLPKEPGNAALRKLRNYVAQASIPMPARMETYNLLTRLGADRVFSDAFLAGINGDQPHELISNVYHNAHANDQLNRMLAFDLKFTLADNDLPKVTTMCELAGTEVAFPLLNDQLVAFSTHLPSNLKLNGRQLRYFFKEALRGYLPDATISKEKHGFGLPFGMWLLTYKPLHELAYDSLNDLKSRRIVNAGLLDELMNSRLADHAPYYGTMVWVLMMLEQWFKQHESA